MADTRRQILLTIKEQTQLLQEEPADDPRQHRWSPQQWWEAYTYLFVNHSSLGHQQHQDDLLFFVRRRQQQLHPPASSSSSSTQQAQVFVRRKGKQLPDDLQLTGQAFDTVDWAQSVLLNLVLHSQYELTVVACGPEGLPFVAEGRTWSAGMIAVMRPVYASTTVTAANLADTSSRAKDSNPQPCYPDICFAVDNFDNAFEDLVLEHASRCYCVVLHAVLDAHEDAAAADLQPGADLATDMAAHLASQARLDTYSSNGSPQQQQQQLGSEPPQQQQPSSNGNSIVGGSAVHATPAAGPDATVSLPGRHHHSSTDESGSSAWQIGTHKRTLFAGYVSFQQILDFMEGSGSSSSSSGRNGRSLLDSWLRVSAPKGPQKDKVVMTGPGGMGRCEVAVTKLELPAAWAANSSNNNSSSSANGGQQPPQLQQGSGAGAAAAAAQQHQQPAGGAEQQQQQRQGLLQRGLLQRGLQRARVVASGVQQALDVLSDLQPAGGVGAAESNMLCALMSLRLPVHYLAQELLAAV